MINVDIMDLIAILVGVIGGLKALEWLLQKITSQHDKAQKIDTNAENFEQYKASTDKKIADLEKSVSNAHNFAQGTLDEMKKEILTKISNDRDEYIKNINDVKKSINDMSSVYHETVSVIELKIETLSDRVEKHNSVVERTYELEKNVGILENRESVSEHRLNDLEGKK